jgi:hypothetical protein
MDKSTVQTGDSPRIEINVSANLSIKGWDRNEVVAKCSSSEDLVLDAEGDEISINSKGNTSLRVPYGATFEDGHISGDVSIKTLEGRLNISNVSGNLSLRSVGTCEIDKISGNLSAKNINGNLRVTSCLGNISVRDIQGDLMIDTDISGNFSLKEIDGNAQARARGNVSVELDPSPESRYEFQAKGNLTCRMPDDASVQIEIERGANIQVKMPGVEVPAKIATPYQLVLGEGDAQLLIGASGNVSLVGRPIDWDLGEFEVEIDEDFEQLTETLNEQIASQIEAQMEMMEEELEHQLDSLSFSLEKSAMSAEQAERIAARAREASERANRRAQDKIRRSQEKMQRKLDAAQRRAERKARAAERAARDRRRRPEPPLRRPVSPSAASEPVSEQERLMILQMLEQGNISMEEAEQLLTALEGKKKRG